jgi:hypothetical protein
MSKLQFDAPLKNHCPTGRKFEPDLGVYCDFSGVGIDHLALL